MTRLSHDSTLRRRLQRNLTTFQRRAIDPGRRRRAAVALTVCPQGDSAAVIVTRRSPDLRAHSRQWALPGGRMDPGESATQTALRELREEVALHLDASAVLGLLDDYATRSGYLITPVVVWSGVGIESLTANPEEVEAIQPFSLGELSRPDSPVLEQGEDGTRQVLSMHFHDDRIFAPTGAMLYQFREVALFGRLTRVAHFDQPRFAWR